MCPTKSAWHIITNLTSGSLAIICHADFVGHILVSQLLLGLADETDFRNGVDAVGIEAGIGGGVVVIEGPRGRDATLFHGDRSQRRKADDIANSEDVSDFGLIVLVDGNATAI